MTTHPLHRHPCRSLLPVLWHLVETAAGLALATSATQAATIDIANDSAGVHLAVTSPANTYFALESSGDLTSWTDDAMKLGGAAVHFNVNPLPGNPRRFYRARVRLLTDPGDADGDGIDDVYELNHPSILNPLLSDGQQDADGDGDSNWLEYLDRTDPTDPFNGTLPLQWSQPNPYGIQIDAGANAWHAGRVNDVLPQPQRFRRPN